MHGIDPSHRPTSPVGAHASWLAVAALGIGSFAFITTEFLPVGLLPQIAADVGVTVGQAGFMVTGPGIAAAITAPLSIGVASQVNRRTLLCVCLSMVCASNLVVVASNGFGGLLLARILMGAALGVFWTIAGSLGPRLRPGAQGARATAIILSGISLGTVAGVPAGALIGAHAGWRMPFVATAILAGIVVVALLALMPPIAGQRNSGLRAVPMILARPHTLLAVGATLLLFGGQCGAYTFIAPYLEESIHIGARMLSVVLLGYGVAGFVGNLAGGWLASRNERGAVAAAALLLTASITSLALLDAGLWFAFAGVGVWGLAYGMMPVTLQTYTLSSAPDHLESAAAILVTAIQVSIGVGSSIGGFATDRFGMAAALWLCVAAAAFTAGLLWLGPSLTKRSAP